MTIGDMTVGRNLLVGFMGERGMVMRTVMVMEGRREKRLWRRLLRGDTIQGGKVLVSPSVPTARRYRLCDCVSRRHVGYLLCSFPHARRALRIARALLQIGMVKSGA